MKIQLLLSWNMDNENKVGCDNNAVKCKDVDCCISSSNIDEVSGIGPGGDVFVIEDRVWDCK